MKSRRRLILQVYLCPIYTTVGSIPPGRVIFFSLVSGNTFYQRLTKKSPHRRKTIPRYGQGSLARGRSRTSFVVTLDTLSFFSVNGKGHLRDRTLSRLDDDLTLGVTSHRPRD